MFAKFFKKRTYITVKFTKTVPCLYPRSATEIRVTDATMLFEVHGFFGS